MTGHRTAVTSRTSHRARVHAAVRQSEPCRA
jgi:hypothetical protein